MEYGRPAIATILKQLEPRERIIVALSYYLGMRPREIASARWTDIDWHRQTIAVRRCKRGLDATYPIPPGLLDALIAWMQDPSRRPGPWIVTGRNGHPLGTHTISAVALAAARSAGLTLEGRRCPWRHALAHSLAAAGATAPDVRAILGHRRPTSTMRYLDTAGIHGTGRTRALLEALDSPLPLAEPREPVAVGTWPPDLPETCPVDRPPAGPPDQVAIAAELPQATVPAELALFRRVIQDLAEIVAEIRRSDPR